MGTSAGGKKLIDTVRFAGSGKSRKDVANYMQTQFPDKRISYAGQPSTPTPNQIPNQELTNLPQEQGVSNFEQRKMERRKRRGVSSFERRRTRLIDSLMSQPSTPTPNQTSTPNQIPNQELTNLPQEQGVPSFEQRRKSLIDSLKNFQINS